MRRSNNVYSRGERAMTCIFRSEGQASKVQTEVRFVLMGMCLDKS